MTQDTTKLTVGLIDADTLIYAACSGCEREVDWGGGLTTLHSTEASVAEAFDTAYERLYDAAGLDHAVLALTDKALPNFRKAILPSYKSNRTARLPLLMRFLRQYVVDNYQTFVRPGLEADDIVGIIATAPGRVTGVPDGNRLIISGDKDLMTIPGVLYNPRTGITATYTEEQADFAFYCQVLSGDRTDGYDGVKGFGPVKAVKTLERIKDPKDYWPMIVETYEKNGRTAEDALRVARVARILRFSDYNFKKREPILWTPLGL